MIVANVRQSLTWDDLLRLVEGIGRRDPVAGRAAVAALDAGHVDRVLDSDDALSAVRAAPSLPPALPFSLLWYVPLRAELRARGEFDAELADYGASVCVALLRTRVALVAGRFEPGLADWSHAIDALPDDSVARAELASDCGALALWWAGVFPERLERTGDGALRAYVTFAARALDLAGVLLRTRRPGLAALYQRAAAIAPDLREALASARRLLAA
jgi:hypothetical protein